MPEKVITPDQGPSTANSSSKNLLNMDVEIKGNLKFAGELTFDGRLEGDVQTDGVLNLGENAHVTGNINAQNVLARGKVNGNITAKDKVEIKARTELFGDIRAAKLVIEEGVTFVGKIEVNPNKVAPGAPGARPGEGAKPPELGKLGGR
jgi:cytoskeletal protein CcmA (bactofilin family)